ncbi:MAG: cofactor-independent phosphoglycerate mutase [Candidatus Margulisbacteria bacterium]|nr:cofactor-independent phosphoglycerate mutase [Candidatus Margulisiibacteriota bacterium]
MTKYLVLIGDGMSDLPLKELGGKTPLEAAKTPNLDWLAQNGAGGWTRNIPSGLEPGSDVAAMSIFGYDPKKYYSGRGPLEAASLNIKLNAGEVAFRCNLVSVENGRMKDFTAGHISTAQAKKIFELLNKKIGTSSVRFYPGLSYRNLLIMKDDRGGSLAKLKTVPPHDITGRPINDYLPKGKAAECLISLMNESEVILHGLKTKATMIWPWGQGKSPRMSSFRKKFGKKAAVITAVHLLKGLGKILGMEIINVPGATGYLDTNYKGKADYALKALTTNDVVFIHVEAPDEAGHEGNVKHKIKAIEDFDRLVVGTILLKIKNQKLKIKIMVLPDHPTPIRLMTHTADPVPFLIYPSRVASQGSRIAGYNEREMKKSKLKIAGGHTLLGSLFGGKF